MRKSIVKIIPQVGTRFGIQGRTRDPNAGGVGVFWVAARLTQIGSLREAKEEIAALAEEVTPLLLRRWELYDVGPIVVDDFYHSAQVGDMVLHSLRCSKGEDDVELEGPDWVIAARPVYKALYKGVRDCSMEVLCLSLVDKEDPELNLLDINAVRKALGRPSHRYKMERWVKWECENIGPLPADIDFVAPWYHASMGEFEEERIDDEELEERFDDARRFGGS